MSRGLRPAGLSEVTRALAGQIGQGNLQVRGVSFGRVVNGGPAGNLNAVWALVRGLSGNGDIDVPHKLGQRPQFCVLWEVRVPDNEPGAVAVLASAVNKEKWSASSCRMRLHHVSGNSAASILVFMVGGD